MDDVYGVIIERRNNAPNCTICGIKLFDYLKALDTYFYIEKNFIRLSKEEMWYWFDYFRESYPYDILP